MQTKSPKIPVNCFNNLHKFAQEHFSVLDLCVQSGCILTLYQDEGRMHSTLCQQEAQEPWWVPCRSSSMGDDCELQWWNTWGNTPGFTVQMQPKWPAPGYKGTINASFLPFEIQQKYHAKIKTNKNSFIILPCTVSTNSLVIFPAILLATHV